MSNISLVETKRKTGNDWLKEQLDKLEEDGVVMEDVIMVYTTNDTTEICNNKMKGRDLAYLVCCLNQWFYKTL